jgi:chemotaxis protein CheX
MAYKMKTLLYATDNIENSESLRSLLADRYKLDRIDPVGIRKTDDYLLIIYDWKTDLLENIINILDLRTLCDFKDIPILLCITDGQYEEAEKALSLGATGIIRRPFKDRKILKGIEHALKPIGTAARLDARIVSAFIKATIQTLKNVCDSEITQKDIFLKKDYYLFGDISGLMAITGEADIALRMELASRIVSDIMGGKPLDIPVTEVQDGAGELINQISGLARHLLWRSGYKFEISLPTIITGFGHKISHLIDKDRRLPIMTIIFECYNEPLALQLCMSTANSPEPRDTGSMTQAQDNTFQTEKSTA